MLLKCSIVSADQNKIGSRVGQTLLRVQCLLNTSAGLFFPLMNWRVTILEAIDSLTRWKIVLCVVCVSSCVDSCYYQQCFCCDRKQNLMIGWMLQGVLMLSEGLESASWRTLIAVCSCLNYILFLTMPIYWSLV